MLKTVAALGVIAALGLTPVVALAQDTTPAAPAASDSMAAKPMKSHKMKSHKKMHKSTKAMAPAEAPKS